VEFVAEIITSLISERVDSCIYGCSACPVTRQGTKISNWNLPHTYV